ncbi:MAG: hypothetical protein EA357_10480 [Micavibrio sp.]|nr:MAG: hypothetical protein EA357_10480 [Micavibrio sp.]
MTQTESKKPVAVEIAETAALMRSFAALLQKETAALRGGEYEAAKQMQEEKRDLAERYQRRIQNLSARKEEIGALPEEEKEKIIRMRLEFSKILEENMRVIDGVRKSSRRLAEKIIDAARATIREDAGYNAAGRIYSNTDQRISPVSLSMNETL